MRQLFLLVLLFFAGRWLVKAVRASEAQGARRTARSSSAGSRAKPGSLAEPVVRCAACGVHAPKSESVFAGGQYFCCAEHASRHAARAAGSR
ncbi:PP0621 family protein [Trinickia caryophylli]|uniref:Deaminase n=1 Tax=Trinickia caryophylli TaxID=28094 RepID=A0A1X7C9W9_TRICW|nr:PP0621 family protein [Trinickia caryophylli]PMS09336.1 deaminase [Trinickia caryophylli]TRX19594.1 deaminase [Trinickia caryophylli]WQE13093.1 PP0621 family protein [Trinickia caryophylli]SME92511.1 uncharacterized protein SAMN06295900_10148 [Trinickia caryophylli]